jgi:intracellular sulfur oxidation DsrE/DsrF family protein
MIREGFFRFVSTAFGALAVLGTARPVAAAAAPVWTPPYFPILMRGEYDYDAMMRSLPADAPHKQVFLSNPSMLTAPGVAGLFQKMTLAMTAYEFALEKGERLTLALAAVLIAEPVVFALNDAMWRKYRIAATLSLPDRGGRIGTVNFTRAAWSDLNLNASPNAPGGIYHDFTSQALQKRGAKFLVCHNALAGVSAKFALRSGIPHPAVLKEWTANLLPGFVAVPSGAQAVQVAQERGFSLYPVTD